MAAVADEAGLKRLQGNLIRTPEGKICILDFGLMTEVTPDQSIALVEYISHLSVEDWDAVAVDLRKLGFIPPGGPERSKIIHAGAWSAVAVQMHKLGLTSKVHVRGCEGPHSVQEAGCLGERPALSEAWAVANVCQATCSSKWGIIGELGQGCRGSCGGARCSFVAQFGCRDMGPGNSLLTPVASSRQVSGSSMNQNGMMGCCGLLWC